MSSFRNLKLHVEQAKLNSSNKGRTEGTRERKMRGKGQEGKRKIVLLWGQHPPKAEGGEAAMMRARMNGEYSVQLY